MRTGSARLGAPAVPGVRVADFDDERPALAEHPHVHVLAA
jgi:hypothetical protein